MATDVDTVYSFPLNIIPPNEIASSKNVSNKSVTNGTSENIGSHHEHFVVEIESSEDALESIGPLFRAIYDGDDHELFMQRLDERIKNHDRDIEKMCNFHYQGFIDSIHELLQLRSEAEQVKGKVQAVNSNLQRTGSALISRAEAVMQCQQIQMNISSTIERLSTCLPVFLMYGKLKKQMDCKRYYPALKTLEQLEHTYLPRVSEYRFTKVMYDQIVRLRDGIKEASMSDLKDFLENIRKYSSKIGEVAMQHVADQHGLDPTFVSMPEKKRKAPPPPNPFTGEAEATVTDQETNIYKDGDEELSAQELVDFSPVYRCWHIYNVLGAGEEFESYYRKQRKKQAKLCLQPATNMHETLDGYKKYFHEIIGFFVVEDNILHTTTGLITSGYLDELWDMALSKIVAVLRTHSAYCTDPSLMLDIKILIIFFCHTLEGYGFPVTRLYGLLIEIRDQYNEILMKRWKNTFMDIFEDDNYTPITLHYQAEYTAIVTIFPFKDEFVEKSPFPKRFPFSEFVPRVYQQVKEYIYACLKFSEDLNLSQAEIDDMVRKSTNFLLTRTLSGCLSSLIRRPGLGLAQLIQIAINTEYLEIACIHLEEFISSITGISREATHVAKLQGKSMFKDARSHAEQQIYLALNHKIDEFMELVLYSILPIANYEWTLVESKGHASGYLMDLVAFLQSTFMSFTNLPDKVAQTACMSACKHIAESITNLLLDHDTKILSAGAIQQVNLDVIQCEQFASLEPVPGFTVGALQMTFSELRQILDLAMSDDWSSYLADFGKDRNKYSLVSPQTAVVLVEKISNGMKKTGVFTSMKKPEKERKKLLETVLKQLRALVNSSAMM